MCQYYFSKIYGGRKRGKTWKFLPTSTNPHPLCHLGLLGIWRQCASFLPSPPHTHLMEMGNRQNMGISKYPCDQF